MVELSCATLGPEGFGDSGFEKTFAMVPQAGYRYIEVNLWHATMLTPEAIGRLARGCAETGLRVSSLFATYLGGNPQRQEVDLAHKLHFLDLCLRFDCTRLVLSSTPVGRGGSKEALIGVLNLLAPVAADRGIQLCLENHHRFELDTIADYEEVLGQVPHANVGICIDTGHFDASAVSMPELIEKLGERVNHLHVKENRTFGEQSFCFFGEGTTDNAGIIERLLARGYEGFIVVEQSPQGRATTIEDLRKPYAMFEGYVRGA